MTESEKKELLQRARNDFVIGTKFLSAYSRNEKTVGTGEIYMDRHGDILTYYGDYIYHSQKWAEILYSPKPKNILEFLEIY